MAQSYDTSLNLKANARLVKCFPVGKQQQYERMHQFTQNTSYTRQQVGYYMVSKLSQTKSSIQYRYPFIPSKNVQLPQLIDNINAKLTNVDLNKHYTNDYVPKNSIAFTHEITDVVSQFTIENNKSANANASASSRSKTTNKNNNINNIKGTAGTKRYDIKNENIEFVTFRNNLNKLIGSVFFGKDSKYDSFKIDIFRNANNMIYFEIVSKSDEQLNNEENDDSKKYIFWGNYFESIATKFDKNCIENIFEQHKNKLKKQKQKTADNVNNMSDKNKNEINTTKTTNININPIAINQSNINIADLSNNIEKDCEMCSVIEANLNNKHKILIAAEIDCLNKNGEYVEIKTSKFTPKRSSRGGYRGGRGRSRGTHGFNSRGGYNYNSNYRGRGRGRERGLGGGYHRHRDEFGNYGNYNNNNSNNVNNSYSYNHSQYNRRDISNFPQNAYHSRNGNAAKYDPYTVVEEKEKHSGDGNMNQQEKNLIDKNSIFLPWYRAIKYWIQSYLVGCENLVIGWRNENGQILGVTQHKLNDIYDKYCVFRNDHKKEIALNFLDEILTFIKTNVKEINVHYQIVFDQPFDQLRLYKLN